MTKLCRIKILSLVIATYYAWYPLLVIADNHTSGMSLVVGVYGENGYWKLPVLEKNEAQVYELNEEALFNLVNYTKNKNVELRVFQNVSFNLEQVLALDDDEEPKCPEDDDPLIDPETIVVLGCNGGAPDIVNSVTEFMRNEVDASRAQIISPSR